MLSVFKQSEIKAKYSFGEVLGTGTFGEVRKGTNKETGEKVAVKIVEPKDRDDERILKQEIEILAKLDHPNIIKLIEIFENKSKITKSRRMYIVMELVTGGEMFDRIIEQEKFNEKQAAKVVRTIFQTLEYMHENGVVHRDLKPENILFATSDEDSEIKVADFGLAKLFDPDEVDDKGLKTMCGTPGYVAPEVLKPKNKKLGYDPQVDVWSAGVILYILLCGFPPFYEEEQDKLFRQIVRGNYDFPKPYWDNISPEAIDLVKRCLVVDSLKRITPTQALQHPFLQEEQGEGAEIDTTKLKQYTRRQKFKKVKNAIVAVGRLQLALKNSLE